MAKTATKTKETTVTDKTTDGADVNPVLAKHDMEALAEKYKTKSAMIRFLAAQDFKTGDIAKAMNIRYQHAYNVLKQEQSKSGA